MLLAPSTRDRPMPLALRRNARATGSAFQLSGFCDAPVRVAASAPRLQLKLGQIDDFHYDFRIICIPPCARELLPGFQPP
jgi:hypothetical protein